MDGQIDAAELYRRTVARYAQRAFFEQLAAGAGYALNWQELDAERNIAVSDAIMRGDPGPMRKMLDELIRDQ